jgi:hypothetical protein
VLVSRELLGRVTSEPDFMQWVITGHETWVFGYDPTTKIQSSEWHTSQSPRPKKARMSRSRVKSTLIILFIQRELFTRSLCHPDRLWIKYFTYRYSSIWETGQCTAYICTWKSNVKLGYDGCRTRVDFMVTQNMVYSRARLTWNSFSDASHSDGWNSAETCTENSPYHTCYRPRLAILVRTNEFSVVTTSRFLYSGIQNVYFGV